MLSVPGRPEAENVNASPSGSDATIARLTVAPTRLDWFPGDIIVGGRLAFATLHVNVLLGADGHRGNEIRRQLVLMLNHITCGCVD